MWKKLRDDQPDDHTCWSLSLMARETGNSTAQLSRWWSDARVQPHRVRTFQLSGDRRFEAKLRDVIAVYEKKGSRRRDTNPARLGYLSAGEQGRQGLLHARAVGQHPEGGQD